MTHTSPLARAGRSVALPLLALACLWAAKPLVAGCLLVNETPSVPRGLYLRISDRTPRPGEVVAARQPLTAAAYLAPLGVPPAMPLLKRVAGVSGDRVCRDGDTLTARSRVTPILTRDSRATPLPAWVGCRALGPDEVLLLGDTLTSFDSRYFGPVHRSEIFGVYQALLTW